MKNTSWQSKTIYHGQKSPRTLHEAFGPYATLYPTTRRRPGLIRSVLLVAAVFAVAAYMAARL